jgi:hypothetical protein
VNGRAQDSVHDVAGAVLVAGPQMRIGLPRDDLEIISDLKA